MQFERLDLKEHVYGDKRMSDVETKRNKAKQSLLVYST